MEPFQEENIYKAESADEIVSELFSGKVSLEQSLQKLRTRLLDLSTRNRLLSYRHPKGRSFQFVDKPNLDLVFTRLIDGKPILIKHVQDPPPLSNIGSRPEVKIYAQSIGINTETEFRPSSCGSCASKHTPKLQVLYYPSDLEKFARKLASEARTVIEETGTNMLYLIFGFMEFFEREDSDKSMLAPLLAVPVTLEKGAIDNETRTYQYSVVYSGEDIHENQTLREKLSQNFNMHLPEFEEEEDPSSYFSKIQHAIKNKQRWQVKHQLTLGFLSFGKLAIWNDLDPDKWPGLLSHPLINAVFSGSCGQDAKDFQEDYDIDKHPQGDLPIIYDADSSQHSAIIDVLSGKNMVINGPPGTGKSQTITNIIATALRDGKKVLFVSEKLAALEVVRQRLNHAGLGHFCLELHSHKTQKKRLLNDIQERLDEHFRPQQQRENKLSLLRRHKNELNRYAELMASRVGNELGLTVHEIFWRTEYQRQDIGDLANLDASNWSLEDIELRRAKLEALGQLYVIIGNFDSTHPWWGYTPQPLTPGDDKVVGRIVVEAFSLSEELLGHVQDYQKMTGVDEEPALGLLENLFSSFNAIPDPSEYIDFELIPRVFSTEDPFGRHTCKLLTDTVDKIESARELNRQADVQLVPNCEIDYDTAEPIISACSQQFRSDALSVPLHALAGFVDDGQQSFTRFEEIVSHTPVAFMPIQNATLEALDAKITALSPLVLLDQPIQSLVDGISTISREVPRLRQSLSQITSLAIRRDIDFDGSPAAVKQLGHPDGIDEVLAGAEINESVILKAQQIADYVLSDLPIAELNRRQHELHKVHDQIAAIFEEICDYAHQFDIEFDGTPRAIAQLNALCQIASRAPFDLLDYRTATFGHPGMLELVKAAEEAHSIEKSQMEQLATEFYIDTLPEIDDLKYAMRAFRRGDSFLNIFSSEWRTAKKLFHGICKKKAKHKATEYEVLTLKIINWMEHRASFNLNEEFKGAFGSLFKGQDTDFSKIRRLHTWYAESQAEVLKHPGLNKSLDLSTIDSHKIFQIAAQSSRVQGLCSEIVMLVPVLNELLGTISKQFDSTLLHSGWLEYQHKIHLVADGIKKGSIFLGRFVRQDVSPKRSVEVLKAKLEILSAQNDFDALNCGLEELHRILEPLLPGFSSIPCHFWGEYLDMVYDIVPIANDLKEFICQYGQGETIISDIRVFFERKLELDTTIKKFSLSPPKNIARDWNSHISIIQERIDIGYKLIKLLSFASDGEKSVKQVSEGLICKKNSIVIINEITNNNTVTTILQDLFQGIDTDLDSLKATLSWCELIIENKSIRSSPLKTILLSQQGRENFEWVHRSLRVIVALHESIRSKLDELTEFGSLNWGEWNSVGHGPSKNIFASNLFQRVRVSSNNIEAILPWSKYYVERRDCVRLALGDFVTGLEQNLLLAGNIGEVFEFVVYRSIGRNIYKNYPELEGFSGAKHEKKRAAFVALDHEIINHTGKDFAYKIDKMKVVPDGEFGYRASDLTEMQLLRRELGKQRRHLPIRQLIKRAGQAIQALKPCFMMGPMSVAQYLEKGSLEFDLVVMDEASQLRPEEALGAIARGNQLVVVGDPKQLPPTNFFDRLLASDDEDEDDESPAVLVGSESILDICQQLFHPVRTLRWHYRSQHESLIAFSNHQFYNGKLLVFPSPFDRNSRLGLRYRYIKNGTYKDRQNVPEAQRLVDAAIAHMMNFPEESLGIVTLNQTQRELIEDLIDKKSRNITEAQIFIANWEKEGWPFFVKNLENVQGDERDVIFISTTFGKAFGTEKVRQNFGPISRPDGWRRLNVLFTRARRKIELFTSMLPEDILVDSKTPAGTKALKDYLDYAKRGILPSTKITDREPDSDFEIAVGDRLRNYGYEVVPQLGVAGFFIDLAVRNPDRLGEFLAAVECDGAAYHSSKSARDRDRIRQEILESLGWKDRIFRLWSTDWFYNPRRESERLLAFLEGRRAVARAEDPPDYNIDEEEDKLEEVNEFMNTEISDDLIDLPLPITEEDLFVEVGDRVTYCFVENSVERHSVTIVDMESNPRLNLINENTPLAIALLNSAVGDEAKIEVKGTSAKIIRILKIQR